MPYIIPVLMSIKNNWNRINCTYRQELSGSIIYVVDNNLPNGPGNKISNTI